MIYPEAIVPPSEAPEAFAAKTWSREDYEYDLADRVVSEAASLRHANQRCAEIESRSEKAAGTTRAFAVRSDKDWMFWNAQRAGAANQLVLLARAAESIGIDAAPGALGELAMARYRSMIRNGRDGREPAPAVYVPDGWLKSLDVPEILALAPRIWRTYLDAHRATA